MQTAVQNLSRIDETSHPNAALWAGRIISSLMVFFLAFDGLMKLIREPHVLAASAELGYPIKTLTTIGALLIASIVVYVIPRKSVLGAILLTGYLGGAVASNVRIGHPAFECIFPVICGMLVWAGLLLREPKLGDKLLLRGPTLQ